MVNQFLWGLVGGNLTNIGSWLRRLIWTNWGSAVNLSQVFFKSTTKYFLESIEIISLFWFKLDDFSMLFVIQLTYFDTLWWEISGFCLLLFCQNERFLSLLSLYTFWGKYLFFQFLIIKMQNYALFDIIVHFIIQNLKNKHTFLKKYKNWES